MYKLLPRLSIYFLFFCALAILFLVFASVLMERTTFRDGQVVGATIGGQTYQLEVAKSDAARARGLSNRAALDSQAGMLFVFNANGYHTFWMKDTLIPLEVLWLDDNFRVVDKKLMSVEQDPSNPISRYTPLYPARYAIEINPLDINDPQVGDKINVRF